MILYAALLVLGLVLSAVIRRPPAVFAGAVLLLAGVGIFGARLHHEGGYPFPQRWDLVYGVVGPVSGALLVWLGRSWRDRRPSPWTLRALFALVPLILVGEAAAVLHEVEEVVEVRTTDDGGSVVPVRLFVADYDGVPWVITDPRGRHVRRMRANPRVELVRGGAAACKIATLVSEPEIVGTVFRRRTEKYLAQRAVVAIGDALGLIELILPEGDVTLAEIGVAIRFDPCPGGTGAARR